MVSLVNHNAERFSLGRLLATPGALSALTESSQSPAEFVSQHAAGNWGTVSAEDKALNEESLIDGSRILSAYTTRNGQKIWIITEAADDAGQRVATTILLPEEY